MKLLDYDRCPAELLDEIRLSQTQFNALWGAGLFRDINRICDVLIDEYEDDCITQLSDIQKVIDHIEGSDWPDSLKDLLASVTALANKAIKYKTSIHFYF